MAARDAPLLRMTRTYDIRLWHALPALALVALSIQCSGPEAFRSRSVTGGQAGSSGAAGTAGSTGAAGDTPISGAAGDTGAAGTTGAGGSRDGGTDAPATSLKVLYECRQNGASVLSAEFSIKVVNTGAAAIPLNSVNVRYWYTIDGTGAQAGTCTSTAHPCTISFQSATPAKPTADQYAVISFGNGSLAPGADTGEIMIQFHGTGAYNQGNDYSFLTTGANFLDAPRVTGHVMGKLVWGTAP
jgi:hypothetical protein